jgi:hypothetical protein
VVQIGVFRPGDQQCSTVQRNPRTGSIRELLQLRQDLLQNPLLAAAPSLPRRGIFPYDIRNGGAPFQAAGLPERR